MRRQTTVLSTLVLGTTLVVAGCGGNEAPPAETAAPAEAPAAHMPAAPTGGWMVTDGIAPPESVYVDAGSGWIFSSQIDGAPDGRDGNGRIAQLGGDVSSFVPEEVVTRLTRHFGPARSARSKKR